MALSDSLFNAYYELKEDYLDYTSEHKKKWTLHEEIEHILDRLDAIVGKIDSDDYRGTYRYEDNGAYVAFVQVNRNIQNEIIALAGDLNVDFKGRAKCLKDLDSEPFLEKNGGTYKFRLALEKVCRGDYKIYHEIRDKHLKPYQKEFNVPFPKIAS